MKTNWKKVVFFGCVVNAWVCPDDLQNCVWVSGHVPKNKEGFVLAQVDSDGPFRWLKLSV